MWAKKGEKLTGDKCMFASNTLTGELKQSREKEDGYFQSTSIYTLYTKFTTVVYDWFIKVGISNATNPDNSFCAIEFNLVCVRVNKLLSKEKSSCLFV